MATSNILIIHQLSDEIISLIESSKEFCFLVTPYFKPWTLLDRTLDKAALLNKNIVFVLRYPDKPDDQKKQIALATVMNNKGFDVHLVARLHTKLYLNERMAILTSMNLYDSSNDNNYEVGYKFSSAIDAKRFKETVIDKDVLALKPKMSLIGRYGEELKQKADQRLEKERRLAENKLNHNAKNGNGFCIRCQTETSYNPFTPYCLSCYHKWSLAGRNESRETYCHKCGEKHGTTFSHPLCYSCFTKN